MERSSTPLSVGVEYDQDVRERGIGHQPGWTKSISTMDKQIAKSQLWWHTNNTEASINGQEETLNDLEDWLASQRSGHAINGQPERPKSTRDRRAILITCMLG